LDGRPSLWQARLALALTREAPVPLRAGGIAARSSFLRFFL
jgi:hypothetical protein